MMSCISSSPVWSLLLIVEIIGSTYIPLASPIVLIAQVVEKNLEESISARQRRDKRRARRLSQIAAQQSSQVCCSNMFSYDGGGASVYY